MFHGHINTSYTDALGAARNPLSSITLEGARRRVVPFRRELAPYHMRETHPVKVCEIQVLSAPRQLAAITQSLVAGLRVRKISRLTSSLSRVHIFTRFDICSRHYTFPDDTSTDLLQGCVSRNLTKFDYLSANVRNYFCDTFGFDAIEKTCTIQSRNSSLQFISHAINSSNIRYHKLYTYRMTDKNIQILSQLHA